MQNYTAREMMAIAAAREIKDSEIIFCGTGISMVAAMAAKHIYAPESVIIFETGSLDPKLAELPLTVADSRVMHAAAVNSGLADAFAIMQNRFLGSKIVGILGAAQIDKFGNLNSTVIGDYYEPDVRFPGSGGACDVASFVSKTLIFMQHEKRKFVDKLDYLTSPGWLDGANSRETAGLQGGGPFCVITDIAVMRFDEKKEMYLAGTFPGIPVQQVLDNTGFELDVARAAQIPPPTNEELRILRETCDPQRLILG